MKKCCKETFKRALEQVLFSIDTGKITSVDEILNALKYAISMLNAPNKESK